MPGPQIVSAQTRETMKQILAKIQDGSFAKAWIAENEQGRPSFTRRRTEEQDQLLEQVGIRLRAMMPFLNPVTVKPDGVTV